MPQLTAAEKIVAGKFGQSDEEYARSRYATELTDFDLAARAQRLGEFVQRVMQESLPDAVVERVWLKTFEGKFRLDCAIGGVASPIFIEEELVDDLFEGGDSLAEEKIRRIVNLSLPARTSKAS
ncbi:MAG: hypothetical protein ACYCSN_04895 [Acidobacteriaceae bacterium]